MDWKLELVALPVSDVDGAEAVYAEKAGFTVDLFSCDPNGNAWAVQQQLPPRGEGAG